MTVSEFVAMAGRKAIPKPTVPQYGVTCTAQNEAVSGVADNLVKGAWTRCKCRIDRENRRRQNLSLQGR